MVKFYSADRETDIYLTVMLNNCAVLTSKIVCLLVLVRIWEIVTLTFDASGHNPRPRDGEEIVIDFQLLQ